MHFSIALLCQYLSVCVLVDTSPNVDHSGGIAATDEPADASDACTPITVELDTDKHCQHCDHLRNEVSTGY